ncbi:hypothetical protein COLO4_27260 [Corchorus olitorius]|uniref:Uncharacterized protein n=1 Tax=Corchorus olitorius TaxID=93759 RepID=A0A1R3HS04_9ROSI|nr:hypothetical protein COLO4_27260 [Corchorus olitorius]
MRVSLEALAMAGVDYNEWGLSIEKWEADDQSNWPDPHLIAKEELPRVSKHAFKVISNRNSGDNVDVGAINILGCWHGIGRLVIQRIIQYCMSFSIDYNEWGLSIESWEADDESNWPPPHLLAKVEPQRVSKHAFNLKSSSIEIAVTIGAINLECRHVRVSQGGLLIQRIIHCMRSILKLMMRYHNALYITIKSNVGTWDEEF